jgi:hypothetical protein
MISDNALANFMNGHGLSPEDTVKMLRLNFIEIEKLRYEIRTLKAQLDAKQFDDEMQGDDIA